MKFEIYTDKSGKTRWRLCAKNGAIVADGSEGYNTVANARRAIKTFMREVHNADLLLVLDTAPLSGEPVQPRDEEER